MHFTREAMQCTEGRMPLQVWEVASKKLKMDLPGHADEVFTVDWSPDGTSVTSGGKDQVLRIWRQ